MEHPALERCLKGVVRSSFTIAWLGKIELVHTVNKNAVRGEVDGVSEG